jgi:hypothetical protein
MTGPNHKLSPSVWCEDMQKIGGLAGKVCSAIAIVKFRDCANCNLPDLAKARGRALHEEEKKQGA